jgi:hypothetical protein
MKFLVAKGRKLRERAEAPRAIPSAREGFGLGPGKAVTASKACGNSAPLVGTAGQAALSSPKQRGDS